MIFLQVLRNLLPSLNPNRMKKILPLLILFIFISSVNAQVNSVKIGANFFSSIGDAYIAISASAPISQPYVIEIQSNYNGSTEARPIQLTVIAGTNLTNTITIRPALGAAGLVISDSIFGTGMLNINGGDYIIIDGRPGGTGTSRELTIINHSVSAVAGTSAIRLINDAEYNTVMFCNIQGLGKHSDSQSGVIQFAATTGTNGNSNNWITRNLIRDYPGNLTVLPNHCIASNDTNSTGTGLNGNNRITNNDMQNFFNRGFSLFGPNGNNWNIDSNRFMRTTTKTIAAQNCISVLRNITGITISYNEIGDADEVDSFYVQSNIQFTGIVSTNGGTGFIHDNVIAMIRMNSTTAGTMINVGGTNGNYTVTSNTMYNIIQRNSGELRGIVSNSPVAEITSNNINNMQCISGTVTNNNLRGIFHSATGSKVGIAGNFIEGLITSGNSTTINATNVNPLNGIFVGTADSAIISHNDIIGLGAMNTGAISTNAFAIGVTNVTNSVIYSNSVENVFNSSTGAAARTGGIMVYGAPGRQFIYNNIMSIGFREDTDFGNSQSIYGILHFNTAAQTGPLSIYYNSVYINGMVSAGADSTYAFQRVRETPTELKNNIFANIRTGGTGNHYSISVVNSGSNWLPANVSNNDLYAVNSATVGNWLTNTYNLNDWKTNSGADANSIGAAPGFHSLTNFNLLPNSPCYGNATPIPGITTDFCCEPRSVTAPTIGAYEMTSFANPTTNNTVTSLIPGQNNVILNTGAAGGMSINPSTITPLAGAFLMGQYYSSGRTGGFTGVVNMSPYFWTISTDAAFISCSVRFYFNNIPANGVNNFNTLKLMHRRGESDDWDAWDELATTRTATYIEISGVFGFSEFALGGDIDNPLPVEISSFSATVQERNVILAWKTLSEINNSGFDLERKSIQTSEGTFEVTGKGTRKGLMKGSNGESTEGDFNSESTDAGAWTKIANISGNGNSTIEKSYSYTDRNLAKGIYQYRLKQIDFNGNYTYLNLNGDVNIGVPTKFELSQNYPNPFNPTTKINFSLPKDSKVSLRIFDITGREVARLLNNEFKQADYYTIDFNAFNLSSGVYFYQINAGDFMETKKMMLLK